MTYTENRISTFCAKQLRQSQGAIFLRKTPVFENAIAWRGKLLCLEENEFAQEWESRMRDDRPDFYRGGAKKRGGNASEESSGANNLDRGQTEYYFFRRKNCAPAEIGLVTKN